MNIPASGSMRFGQALAVFKVKNTTGRELQDRELHSWAVNKLNAGVEQTLQQNTQAAQQSVESIRDWVSDLRGVLTSDRLQGLYQDARQKRTGQTAATTRVPDTVKGTKFLRLSARGEEPVTVALFTPSNDGIPQGGIRLADGDIRIFNTGGNDVLLLNSVTQQNGPEKKDILTALKQRYQSLLGNNNPL